jgi:hypothetical protein
MAISAPVPKDLEVVLKVFRKYQKSDKVIGQS